MDFKLEYLFIDETHPLYREVAQAIRDLDDVDPDEIKDPEDEPAKPRRKK